jgi:Zn-dependent protease with chaperone function
MTVELVDDTAATPPRARPRVLAMPSPTVSRFALLVAALITSGLFVGTSVHNQTAVGDDWLARVIECESLRPEVAPGAPVEEIIRAQEVVDRCLEAPQLRLVWFALGGTAVAIAGAIVLLTLLPRIIVRRRALRPAGARLEAASTRVSALASELGVAHAPATMVGSSRLRDAFSFGLPGRYVVALPPALAVRSTGSAFEPLVRHELAHVSRRDVVIGWAAASLWPVTAALLLVPVLLAVVGGDLSVLPSYSWRAALLLAVTLVASAGILRSREYDADLGSASTPGRQGALIAVLRASGRTQPGGWRRLVRLHPDPAERVDVLRDPAPAARPSAVDAAVAGFLAAVTLPLLIAVLATVPSLTASAYAVPAALVGPVLGVTVGLALWRSAVVDAVCATRTTLAAAGRVVGAVFTGSLLGQVASLAAVGTGTTTGSRTWTPVVLFAVALAGTTAVVGWLGVAAAGRAWALSARAYAAVAVVGSGLMFAFVLWVVTTLTHALDLGGWWLTGMVAVDLLTGPVAVAVILLVVLAVVVLLATSIRTPPGWAVEAQVQGASADGPVAGDRPVVPTRLRRLPLLALLGVAALLAGVVAFGALTVRTVTGPPRETEGAAMSTVEYAGQYAVSVDGRLSGLDVVVSEIDTDGTLTDEERTQRIRSDVLALLDELLTEAQTVVPADEAVALAHTGLVMALEEARTAFEEFATAYETGDVELHGQASERLDGASLLFAQWRADVSALQGSTDD